LKEKIRIVN